MTGADVLMVGVGGYGIILASDVMAETGMASGYDVKKADTLGMAQRGGSVASHVRWGTPVFSPVIKKGEADFLLGFEELEAMRWSPYLKPGGTALVADLVISPTSAISENTPYPAWDRVKSTLEQRTDRVYLVPASRITRAVGNPRAVNMVLLGFLSVFLEAPREAWKEIVSRKLPPAYVNSSMEAFNAGVDEAKAMLS